MPDREHRIGFDFGLHVAKVWDVVCLPESAEQYSGFLEATSDGAAKFASVGPGAVEAVL